MGRQLWALYPSAMRQEEKSYQFGFLAGLTTADRLDLLQQYPEIDKAAAIHDAEEMAREHGSKLFAPRCQYCVSKEPHPSAKVHRVMIGKDKEVAEFNDGDIASGHYHFLWLENEEETIGLLKRDGDEVITVAIASLPLFPEPSHYMHRLEQFAALGYDMIDKGTQEEDFISAKVFELRRKKS
jgi:hypothetical protein